MSRRDSEMVLSEGPITPPDSPGPEDMIPMDLHQPVEVSMAVEDGRQSAHVDYPATPVSQTEGSDAMEEDIMQVEQVQDIPKPPSRSLSEENLERPGTSSLKLTDFEVRGTLGEWPSLYAYILMKLTNVSIRYWYFRESPSGSFARIIRKAGIDKLLCFEGPQKE